jgi:hypothetical protein
MWQSGNQRHHRSVANLCVARQRDVLKMGVWRIQFGCLDEGLCQQPDVVVSRAARLPPQM